jgi:hypothetical protein
MHKENKKVAALAVSKYFSTKAFNSSPMTICFFSLNFAKD